MQCSGSLYPHCCSGLVSSLLTLSSWLMQSPESWLHRGGTGAYLGKAELGTWSRRHDSERGSHSFSFLLLFPPVDFERFVRFAAPFWIVYPCLCWTRRLASFDVTDLLTPPRPVFKSSQISLTLQCHWNTHFQSTGSESDSSLALISNCLCRNNKEVIQTWKPISIVCALYYSIIYTAA